jgi:hypothetical protein
MVTLFVLEKQETHLKWNILLIKLSPEGKIVLKKLYRFEEGGGGNSIIIAKNGDLIIGGYRYNDPMLMRTDSVGNIKWSSWYYDSLKNKRIFLQGATINSLRETSRGRIICAIGETFPGKAGDPLDNYAAYLEFDSLGTMTNWGQWWEEVGYKISGFSIEEMSANRFIIAGNQAVIGIDTAGTKVWQASYGFMLDGVGSVTNNVTRVKKLRDGTLMVIGQAYEGNCWTNYQRLSYDAWWSPISTAGENSAWDTAGRQGGDDKLYDFTQLNDGKLVFVGKRSSTTDAGGMWTFVTDFSGKNTLWEKMTRIMYGTEKYGTAVTPLSVCATPDGGFTVVGPYNCNQDNGGPNAFAAHFIPVPPVATASPRLPEVSKIHCTLTNTTATFTFPCHPASPVELSIFNAAGKLVHRRSSVGGIAGSSKVVVDASRWARGVYFYHAATGGQMFSGSVVAGMR